MSGVSSILPRSRQYLGKQMYMLALTVLSTAAICVVSGQGYGGCLLIAVDHSG